MTLVCCSHRVSTAVAGWGSRPGHAWQRGRHGGAASARQRRRRAGGGSGPAHTRLRHITGPAAPPHVHPLPHAHLAQEARDGLCGVSTGGVSVPCHSVPPHCAQLHKWLTLG